MRNLILTLAASAAVVAFSPNAAAQGVVAVGDTPSYTFNEETFNTMGAAGGADFAGKPSSSKMLIPSA